MQATEKKSTTPTRRGAMRLSTAALFAGIATTASASTKPSPDAELLEACAEFDALEHRINDLYSKGATPIEDDNERNKAIQPFTRRQSELIDRICTRATTREGLLARARSLTIWAPDLLKNHTPHACWDNRMVATLLRDLLGSAQA
jgi:hypothetical protein